MVAATHRIRRATVTCEAPRGSPARQAAADRLARRVRRDLTPALAAALPANERFYVIDHLACGEIELSDIPEATRVRMLAEGIAVQIAAARNERRVWTFDSEADYVAAFASACGPRTTASAPVWSSLRGCGRATALATALAATAKRDLDLGDVLASLARRMDLTEAVLRAPEQMVDGLLCGLAARPDEGSGEPGTAALTATAQRILTAAGVGAVATTRVASAIRSEPVDWRDPGALADAVSRGVVAGLGGRGRASSEVRASARPAVEGAVRALVWLDGNRLLRRLCAHGGLLAPTARVEAALRALHDALQAVAADLSTRDERLRAVDGQSISLLWNVRFRAMHPSWRDDQLPSRLLTAVTTGSGGVLEASHSPTWKAVEALWIGLAAGPIRPTSRSPALQMGRLAELVLPGAQAATDDASLTREAKGSVPTDIEKHESAGHRRPAMVSPDAPAAEGPTRIVPSRNRARAPDARRRAGGARPETVVNQTAAKDNSVQVTPVEAQEGAASHTLVATRAAGLFLLWRTLVDLRFGAALRGTANEQEDTMPVLRSALWSLALAASGLTPDMVEKDQGARHFARMATGDPAPDPLDAVTEATLLADLRSAPALRSRWLAATATLSDAVLGAFTFWLRGFEHSSPSFVCHRFLRRPGQLWVDEPRVRIEMAPLPLDVVLSRAGYLDPLALPDWLGGLRVYFSVGGGL